MYEIKEIEEVNIVGMAHDSLNNGPNALVVIAKRYKIGGDIKK